MKVSRADVVRVAMARLREEAAAELEVAREAEQREALGLAQCLVLMVRSQHAALVREARASCGAAEESLLVDVKFEATDEFLASPPAELAVVVRDGEAWDCRVQFRVRVRVPPGEMARYVAAVRRRRLAEARSMKASDLGDDARAAGIEKILQETERGRVVLAALKEFSAELREAESGGKVEHDRT